MIFGLLLQILRLSFKVASCVEACTVAPWMLSNHTSIPWSWQLEMGPGTYNVPLRPYRKILLRPG